MIQLNNDPHPSMVDMDSLTLKTVLGTKFITVCGLEVVICWFQELCGHLGSHLEYHKVLEGAGVVSFRF